MKRIDLYFLGYRVFTVEKEDVKTVAQLFLKKGVSVKFEENRFTVPERRVKSICSLLATRVNFSMSEPLGMYGFVYKNRKRLGAMLAAVAVAVLLILSTDVVWDVRVEGAEGLDGRVVSELSSIGFSVGRRWSGLDKSEIEVKMLDVSECVSWININRRGSVAYVSVAIKDNVVREEEKVGYSNLVASFDGVIEEITVLRGVAAVKVGDVVKCGDLLISGILPESAGGGFCYAEGIVLARTFDSISVSVDEIFTEKNEKERKTGKISLKIFDFSLNIFKSYRKMPTECVIIEETEKSASLFGKTLPLTLKRESFVLFDEVSRSLSEDEMTCIAREKMQAALGEHLAGSTLLKISTSGEFSGGAYVLTSQISVLRDIGVDLPFEVNE